MKLVEQLKQDMIEAMKNHEKEKLTVIRMVKGALDKERIDTKKEIDDELLITVVSKQIKMRNDSILEFEKADRNDLAEKTKGEIDILKKYLPEQLDKEEVEKIIDNVINKLDANNIKDMGRVMKEVSPKVKGRYDMKEVSEIIKSILS